MVAYLGKKNQDLQYHSCENKCIIQYVVNVGILCEVTFIM